MKKTLPFLTLFVGLAFSALAVQTSSVREDDYNTLSQGELKSVALTSDGYIVPSYARAERGPAGAEIVWDAVEEKDGSVLCATGHSGRLMRVIDTKTSNTIARFPEPELTAMLRLADGSVLVAAAPTGRIYRLADNDELTTFAKLNCNFVWRMSQDAGGNIWAATGSEGRLFRLRPTSSSVDIKEVRKFSSANLLDLWLDSEGVMGKRGFLYVAGQNPGLLYRLDPAHPEQKPEVVFDSQAEEIRALLPLKDGIALALNTERAPTPFALQLAMRVQGNPEASPIGSPSSPQAARALAPAAQRNYGQPRSQVIVLDSKGFQRELWTSSERPISDLAASPTEGNILAAAGSQGRIFEIDPLGHSSIIVDLREDFIVRLHASGDHYLIATARNGMVFSMEKERAAEAVFISRAVDAKVPVRWGKFYAGGTLGNRQKVSVEFRHGNDDDTDSELWGEWSRPANVNVGEPVATPEGISRYMQYRLTLRQRGADPLRVDWTELFFVEPNRPPRIAQIQINGAPQPPSPGQVGGGEGSQPSQPGPPAMPGRQPAQGKSIERQPRSNTMTHTITWRASDPNSDDLIYALYYREREEESWKLVVEDLTQPRQPISTSQMADGHYRFKVVASDKNDNAPGQALTSELISDEITVDNTPPAIENIRASVDGKVARIQFAASDATSNLAAARYDLNNKNEASMQSSDGVLDQRREEFDIQTAPLEPGEYTATVNVTDREGNTSVARVVFSIGK